MGPELNSIRHLWKELKHAVWRRHTSNLRQMVQFTQEEWVKLLVSRNKSLIESYKSILFAVIVSKGYTAKY